MKYHNTIIKSCEAMRYHIIKCHATPYHGISRHSYPHTVIDIRLELCCRIHGKSASYSLGSLHIIAMLLSHHQRTTLPSPTTHSLSLLTDFCVHLLLLSHLFFRSLHFTSLLYSSFPSLHYSPFSIKFLSLCPCTLVHTYHTDIPCTG